MDRWPDDDIGRNSVNPCTIPRIIDSIKFIGTLSCCVILLCLDSSISFKCHLIKLEIIDFKKDKKDTRLKHVYLNDKGIKLFNEIFDIQKKRIYNALISSSSKEVINFNNVLNKIINEKI